MKTQGGTKGLFKNVLKKIPGLNTILTGLFAINDIKSLLANPVDGEGKPLSKVKEKRVSTTTSKDKSHVEVLEGSTDMEEVKDVKKQVDHKVQQPVKLRKKTSNNTLVKKMSK
jgi:hypothetical protein